MGIEVEGAAGGVSSSWVFGLRSLVVGLAGVRRHPGDEREQAGSSSTQVRQGMTDEGIEAEGIGERKINQSKVAQ
jgi:hypothetical protein